MVLKANDRRTSCPCHDEFRGPRSDYVRQMASENNNKQTTDITFSRMHAELETSAKRFLSESLMLLISDNNDSRAYVEENMVKIALASFFKQKPCIEVIYGFRNAREGRGSQSSFQL
ncbi:hypothetical protein TNCV_420841 [Trichonephila clavipes]|nr:hypothetical protein TNCV_420841 [Trichonephila clavipes]